MVKPSKKWFVLFATAGIIACATKSYGAYADNIILDDSNVSISAAVERYVASISDADEETATVSDATESDATASDATEVDKEEEAEKASEFDGKALVIINDFVNIRSEASIEAEKIGKIGPGGIMNVIEKGDEWSVIASGNCYGYINNEYVAFGDDAERYAEAHLDKIAVVNTTTLKVRESDSEDSDCLTLIPEGEKYGIIEQGNEWTYIEIDDSLSGYVKNEYIDITYETTSAITVAEEEAAAALAAQIENESTATSEANDYSDTATEQTAQTDLQEYAADAATTEAPVTEAPTTEAPATEATTEAPATETTTEVPVDVPVSGAANDVVNYALQFVGNPYVYGGTSLTNGTDCSGFTMSVYAHFGVSLSRTAADQASNGTEVSLSALQPGDLVFYDHGTGYIGHVALYIGNGQIVHASTSRTGIIVASVNYSTPCKAVRVMY